MTSVQPETALPAMECKLQPPIILASGSPRRKELLESLGVKFTVVKPEVDEEAFDLSHLEPGALVLFLARVKAQEVFKHHPDATVIGCDTIVVWTSPEGQKEVFGKPKSRAHAFEMLKKLQGTTHEVYSGITVFTPADEELQADFLATRVTMRAMSDAEIHAYIDTDEPMDKAGAYAIQGVGSTNVEKIDGCYFNVVGMSLYLLNRLFGKLKLKLI